jgi:hypothetical protein
VLAALLSACSDGYGHENRHQENGEAEDCVQQDVLAGHPEGIAWLAWLVEIVRDGKFNSFGAHSQGWGQRLMSG